MRSMMRSLVRTTLACAALLATHALPAVAGRHGGTCGGGGGGGSSGSHGSGDGGRSYTSVDSSSSSSDSTFSESSAPSGCLDDTDVLGYRHCTKFGAWGANLRLPHLFFESGMNVRHFGSMLRDQQGTVTHGDQSFTYRVVMPGGTSAAADVAMTSAMRLGIGLPHGTYAALEGELGGLVGSSQASTEMMNVGTYGSPSVTQGGGLVFGGFAVAGFGGATKHGSLAVELAGGVRSVHYTFDSTYLACNESTTIDATRGLVEARARGELWLSPWLTAGATLGSSVISRGDWMAGVYLGFHSRAFGGGR